jgi:hypothetical protein
MYRIEFTCLFPRKPGQFHRHDSKAAFLDHIDDGAGMAFEKSIRLDHGKGSIAHTSNY